MKDYLLNVEERKMKEMFYRVVKDSGIMNLVTGSFALAIGIASFVSGIRLLHSSTKVLF